MIQSNTYLWLAPLVNCLEFPCTAPLDCWGDANKSNFKNDNKAKNGASNHVKTDENDKPLESSKYVEVFADD